MVNVLLFQFTVYFKFILSITSFVTEMTVLIVGQLA